MRKTPIASWCPPPVPYLGPPLSTLGSHGAIVREIWYWGLYTKICRRIPELVTVGENV